MLAGVSPKSKMANKYDAVILGGGAAGLMCAIEAGKRGRRVAVLERELAFEARPHEAA